MDTRDISLVDVCTAEPTGGVPVGYLPAGDDLTDDQLRAVAGELDATVATPESDGLRVLDRTGPLSTHPHATLGAVIRQFERGDREAGTHDLSTAAGTETVEVTEDGGAWVERPRPTASGTDLREQDIAAALGIDAAALRDVGADLPPMVLSVGADVLAAPVNFLEHVSGASPDAGALVDVAEQAGVDAVCGFTFDTLDDDVACHVRTFVPPGARVGVPTTDLETPAWPALAGGLVSHLYGTGTIESATTAVEQGHFRDRPGLVHVEAGERLRVGGFGVTTLDGTVTVPPAADDDIIEA